MHGVGEFSRIRKAVKVDYDDFPRRQFGEFSNLLKDRLQLGDPGHVVVYGEAGTIFLDEFFQDGLHDPYPCVL